MASTGLLILASGVLLMTIVGTPEVARRIRGMFYGWVLAGLGALGHGHGYSARLQRSPCLESGVEERFRLDPRPNVLGLCSCRI